MFFEWWEHFDPDGPGADRLVAAFEQHRPVFDATLVAFHAACVEDQENVYKQDARRHAHPRLLANWEAWFTFAIGWEPEDFERARAIWPKVQRLAFRLHDTGARLTVGTDMSNPWIAPAISLHREMALLAEAGVAGDSTDRRAAPATRCGRPPRGRQSCTLRCGHSPETPPSHGSGRKSGFSQRISTDHPAVAVSLT